MSFAANPRADQEDPSNAPQEPTGPVASDSLAAESLKTSGGFSENENAAAMGVKGSQSTLNTTDTSGATVLHAAADASEREKQDIKGLGRDEKGVSGLKYPEAAGEPEFGGSHSEQGYAGGPSTTTGGPNTRTGGTYSGATGDSFADGGAGVTSSSSTKTAGISSDSGSVSQGVGKGETSSSHASAARSGDEPIATGGAGEGFGISSQPEANTAPNYAATVSGDIRSEGELKPKGQNLHEGDIPQTKTFTGDVGGSNDPGRVAEQSFLKMDAENVVAAGNPSFAGSGQDSSTGGQYAALSTEQAPDRNY